jgi:hypothetical protein
MILVKDDSGIEVVIPGERGRNRLRERKSGREVMTGTEAGDQYPGDGDDEAGMKACGERASSGIVLKMQSHQPRRTRTWT